MSDKEKKQIIIPTSELEQIKVIINKALVRIISGKTKKTYQQELQLISQTIQKYIHISYITKEEHNKELITQIFAYINYFTELRDKTKKVKGKTDYNQGFKDALNKVISEFKSLIER